MKRWFVYILMNSNDKTYTGVTYDTSPERRLRQHNGELKGGAKFTRANGPWTLIYAEWGFRTRGEAQSREYHLKRDRTFKQQLKASLHV